MNDQIQTPQAIETEQIVIGHALQDPLDVLDAIADKLSANPASFHHTRTRSVYEAMTAMMASEIPVDLVTVCQWFKDHGMSEHELQSLTSDLIDWSTRAISLSNVPHYLTVLRDKKTLRDAIDAAQSILQMVADPDAKASEVMETAQAKLYEAQAVDSGGLQPVSKYMGDAIRQIEAQAKSTNGVADGLETGFKDLDAMLCGCKAGELTYLAARPAMGKTSLALNIIAHIGIDCGIPTDFFSLEMPAAQIARRMACSRAEIDLDAMRIGGMTKNHSGRLMRASKEIAQSKIYIDATAGISIAELRARARRSKLKRGIKLVVIDHLGLMRGVTKKAQMSANGEISEISAALKVMAKELGVHVLCLVQLNREVEKRKGNRPQLSDLRDSGSIEQDADNVLMLTRPAYYMEGEAREENARIAQLIIAKQRDGATGDIALKFFGELCKFKDNVQ